MEPYYVWKHLGDAVEELLIRDASLIERLEAALLSGSLLFYEDDAGLDPRAQPHLQRLRAAMELDPEGPETGQLRYRLEKMEPAEHEALARALLSAFIYQREFAGVEKA